MADDYGMAVSPAFRESPLLGVSDRALRVWLVLASMTLSVDRTFNVGKHTVVAKPLEVLIALRTLRADVGGGLPRLRVALQELADMGAIEIESVTRPARCPTRTRQGIPTGHVQGVREGHATNYLLSRIKAMDSTGYL